jgi:hypothetical protein
MLYENARGNAKARHIAFFLTREDVCTALTEALESGLVVMDVDHPSAPSIDRIDSEEPYVLENIQVVPVWYNLACKHWNKDLMLSEITKWLEHQKDE